MWSGSGDPSEFLVRVDIKGFEPDFLNREANVKDSKVSLPDFNQTQESASEARVPRVRGRDGVCSGIQGRRGNTQVPVWSCREANIKDSKEKHQCEYSHQQQCLLFFAFACCEVL